MSRMFRAWPLRHEERGEPAHRYLITIAPGHKVAMTKAEYNRLLQQIDTERLARAANRRYARR